MKYFYLCIISLISFCLLSCATERPTLQAGDLAHEAWMHEVDTTTSKWLRRYESSFIPENVHSAYPMVVGTMGSVPDFTNIKIIGDFKVELCGTSGNNAVTIKGSELAIREVVATIQGNTLVISQIKKASPLVRQVVVRIAIRQLSGFEYVGFGRVEGSNLHGSHLILAASGAGCLRLSGALHLQRVVNMGAGEITVLGASSNCLDVLTAGTGTVNIAGQINIHSLEHHGSGNINIIGARALIPTTIYADGGGKIGVSGEVNLCNVTVKGYTCVLICGVKSYHLLVTAMDAARVGLTGTIADLTVNTYNNSIFMGRYLCAFDAFMKAHNRSHINIAACNKIFASANQYASIFYFGPVAKLTSFMGHDGVVLAMGTGYGTNCNPCLPQLLDGCHLNQLVRPVTVLKHYQPKQLCKPKKHYKHYKGAG